MVGNGIVTTVAGWTASTPREVVGDGVPFTSFRLATTPRRFDPRAGAWADGQTEWVTVKVFRDTAFNVAASIRKGEPVVAHGRLRTEEWIGENGPRTTIILEATALGHDLTRGTTRFARRVHLGPGADREEVGPESVDRVGPGEVDPFATGGDPDALVEEAGDAMPQATDGSVSAEFTADGALGPNGAAAPPS